MRRRRKDDVEPKVTMCIHMSVADRQLLRDWSYRNRISMNEGLRRGLRYICTRDDQEQPTVA
jgi:hypothetical protein